MICKFCGLNNADDATFCSRCGSPLKENRKAAAAVSSAAPVVDDDKKTMRMETRPEEPKGGGVTVHDCGYPILPGMQVCPKCHRPIGNSTPPQMQDGGGKKTVVISNPNLQQQPVGPKVTQPYVAPDRDATVPKKTERYVAPDQNISAAKKTERFVPATNQEEAVNKKTVNIHQMQNPRAKMTEPELPPHCSLQPVPHENEPAAKMVKQEYSSAEVVLNRQNTEPDNFTITSQQQALLTFEDGKWYIEDRSAFKSTYIRVTRRTELHDGDIVSMGDRDFEFSTK